MAQDKIYTDNRGGYAELPVFSQADANVEYLRKDALLEWAKELKLLLKDKSGAQYEGAEVVVNGIIDKIESL